MSISFEIRGLKETEKRMERIETDLSGDPMLNAMGKATMMVTASAKRFAPVDTGRLRASITPEVRSTPTEVIGVVGSNVKYAPYVELGTKPHWPPISALEVWARRHGTSAFLVARAIARRGTKAHRFLQQAFEQNQARIVALFEQTVKQIVEKD